MVLRFSVVETYGSMGGFGSSLEATEVGEKISGDLEDGVDQEEGGGSRVRTYWHSFSRFSGEGTGRTVSFPFHDAVEEFFEEGGDLRFPCRLRTHPPFHPVTAYIKTPERGRKGKTTNQMFTHNKASRI